MSETDLSTVEEFVLRVVGERKIAPEQLLTFAAESVEVRGFSPGTITSVIWNLVAKGKLVWTPDYELQATETERRLARA